MQSEEDIKTELGEDNDEPQSPEPSEKVSAFIRLALKRFKASVDDEAIDRAKKTNEFIVEGKHWPDDIFKLRQNQSPKLPCLVANYGIVHRDAVAGELMMNLPQSKFRGFAGDPDSKIAEIGTSLLRRIEENSRTSLMDRECIKQFTASGYPAWQYIYHDYPAYQKLDITAFQQEIFIEFIPERFSVFLDPNGKYGELPERGGPKYGFRFSNMPRAEYKKEFPGKTIINVAQFDQLELEEKDWWSATDVRVASYFVAEPKTIKILLLDGNNVIEKDSGIHKALLEAAATAGGELKVLKERDATIYEIFHYKINSREILSGPERVAGRYIPLVPFEGKYDYKNDGSKLYRGAFDNSMDANRMLDMHMSEAAALVATGKQVKGTPKMIEGHESTWENPMGHKYLPFNYDQQFPQAQGPQEINTTTEAQQNLQFMQLEINLVKDLDNIHESTLGEKSNETSGRSQLVRKQSAATSNFEFPANFGEAKGLRTRIIEAMIPEVYTYELTLRIVGEDGKPARDENGRERIETINKLSETPKGIDEEGNAIHEYLNDIQKARFDTVVDIGPGFKTQRMEAAANITAAMQAAPAAAPMLLDLVFKAEDYPGADVAAQRMEFMLEKNNPGITTAGKGGQDDKIKMAVGTALQQFEEQMRPGLQKMEESMQAMNAKIEEQGAELAEKNQALSEATALMKNRSAEIKQKDRDLDIKEREVSIKEKEAKTGAIMAEFSKTLTLLANKIESIDRAMALNIENAKAPEAPDIKSAISPISEQIKELADAVGKVQEMKPTPASQVQPIELTINMEKGTVKKKIDFTMPDGERITGSVEESKEPEIEGGNE